MSEEKELKLKGVDISEFNGDIDFKTLKNHVDFVIIRATYGRHSIDKNFEHNVKECIKYEIPFGVYVYSYALNIEQGKEEVSKLLKVIAPYKDNITYPVIIDMEDADEYKANNGNPENKTLVDICENFCKEVSNAGYISGIYASAYWFKNQLNDERLKPFIKWIAWWNIEEEKINKEDYKLWQYSSKGKVEGIKGNVDLNYSYFDYHRLSLYLKNLEMITYIKLRTGLEDLTIQFMSCYKWGNELLKKIATRLKKPTIKFTNKDIKKVIQKEYELEDKTMDFLSKYVYAEPLFLKLYRAICQEETTLQENNK